MAIWFIWETIEYKEVADFVPNTKDLKDFNEKIRGNPYATIAFRGIITLTQDRVVFLQYLSKEQKFKMLFTCNINDIKETAFTNYLNSVAVILVLNDYTNHLIQITTDQTHVDGTKTREFFDILNTKIES